MLNAEVAGTGRVLVFLHGYTENLTLWHKITSSLRNRYKVILIDLPGFGESPPIETDFTIEDVARRVESFLSLTLNVNEYIVFGHSLGGYVSLALKELFPEKILGLGLINSTTFADSEEKKLFRAKTKEFIIRNGTKEFLKSFVPNLFTSDNLIKRRSEVNKVLEMGESIPTSVLTSYMTAMQNRTDRSNLLINSDNILFVGGLHDQLICIEDIRSQVKMLKSGSEGHILDDVAHMSMIESSESLERLISAFLQKLKSD